MLPATEPFARFIYKKEWIMENNTVAAVAFTPHHIDRKTSLCHIVGLTEAEIAREGVRRMAFRRNPPPLLGRADLIADTVYAQGLDIELNGVPLHANISGWPIEEDAILEIALQLALGSTLRI